MFFLTSVIGWKLLQHQKGTRETLHQSFYHYHKHLQSNIYICLLIWLEETNTEPDKKKGECECVRMWIKYPNLQQYPTTRAYSSCGYTLQQHYLEGGCVAKISS